MPDQKLPKVTVRTRGSDVQESLQSGQVGLDEAAAVIRRRLESGSAFAQGGSLPIRLKNPNLVCRWFNAEKGPDHLWRAKNVGGWAPVTEDMVEDLEQLGGYNLVDGTAIARGERSRERLMCMPSDAYAQIQAMKTAANDASIGSSKKTKADIVQAASVALGDEAASFLEHQTFGEITDSVERATLDHEIPDR